MKDKANKREVLENVYTSKDFKWYFNTMGGKIKKVPIILGLIGLFLIISASMYGMTRPFNFLIKFELLGIMVVTLFLFIYLGKNTPSSNF